MPDLRDVVELCNRQKPEYQAASCPCVIPLKPSIRLYVLDIS